MNNDPVVEEVRRFRDEYARTFHYDLERYLRRPDGKQKRSGHPLVRRERKADMVCAETVEYQAGDDR